MQKINRKKKKEIISLLSFLYGEQKGLITYKKLERLIKKYSKKIVKDHYFKKYFDQKDVVLIIYGDNVLKKSENSLKTLWRFLDKNLKGYINFIHIIGLFLYSSDRGFSIIDYKKINPKLGSLKDLKIIENDFKLMVDFVCNHMSSKGKWFKEFEKGNKNYKDFFIAFDKKPPQKKIEKVFRPRSSQLFVVRRTSSGKKWIWRTFCYDQMDLNYQNPKVLLKMIDVFLFYIENRAEFIRLDAIAYIWKKLGTSCFLTKESHIFVKLLRKILDLLCPSADLIAEVNMGIKENIKYLGDGENEAQIIYNFPLPCLVLCAFYNKNSQKILKWCKALKLPSEKTTFLNLLDCHDGISVVGAKDVLSKKEINKITSNILKNGGKIGYKKGCLGTQEPYEFNITWWNAINGIDQKETKEIKIKRYIAARAISFSLKGIPAVYFLGLFGTENCISCFKKTGKNRDINRKKFTEKKINFFIKNKESKEYKIFSKTKELLELRKEEKAFHPAATQKIIFLNKSIFSIIRTSLNKKENILVLINITKENKKIKISSKKLAIKSKKIFFDLISKEIFAIDNLLSIKMAPFQVRWLKYYN